jgi:HEPN domain-containing protein
LTPEERDEAELLLKLARSDLRAAEALARDPQQSGYIVGFHAQQAVEKAMKAVFASSSLEIPYTHDLKALVDEATRHELVLPDAVAQSPWLTPWAVEMRYGEEEKALDRDAALDTAREAVRWSEGVVAHEASKLGRKPEPPPQ